ncbi:HET-domain-containing protein [Annulohypoxylon truncatum]|uniref:HET-domain-containing protein n=1 Tax=Annulohypoxylon truncatum TaxID=327061 RepID=UPI002007B4D7|nr:HET-domain-containing protein [Annulohypoxylon truncatum]KAI1206340.1 HET-domain-containing protein [Annulohypoxylon truncatum]
MNPIPISITGTLCELCHQFISDIFSFNFTRQDAYPARWHPIGSEWTPEKPWGDAFHHHGTFAALVESAKTCELCNVLHADLSLMDQSLQQGWLGLYPFYSSGRIGANKSKGVFRAGFRASLEKMPWGSSKIGSIPLHSFKVCRRVPLEEGEQVPWLDTYRRLPAVKPTLASEDIAGMVAKWQQECRESHANCGNNIPDHELPTRVIDLGDISKGEAAHIRLYETHGEKAPYATLSHCWGGAIPSITLTTNKASRTDSLPVSSLPQNFKDAIEVTRALGIRYLWIDALCIIQDSKPDWLREAGRMSAVYAGAAVVLSALDAPASTTGFLKPNRLPLATLNAAFGIQKVLPELNDYLQTCPLVSRGWCMQERLLAPRLLHFGREQLFWECRALFRAEDGRDFTGESDGHVMAEFLRIRKRIGGAAARGEGLPCDAWYQLLQEYTTRRFTVATDKLPALAGAAGLFVKANGNEGAGLGATYVAGLWKEDLARGLLWCAHYDHMPGRKVWGISSTDRISALARPTERRAPSWSWAALDGHLDFWALRIGGFVVEVLDVKMSVGENELTEAFPDGVVKLRGQVARMFYHAPDDSKYDVGTLTFGRADSLKDTSSVLNGCVMDLDRRTPRFCWVLVMAQSNDDWFLLVLDKGEDGLYRRIGMVTAKNVKVDSARFQVQEFQIT